MLNGLVSLAAYGLLLRYPKQLLASINGDHLLMAMTAGFGAMALLRSKLFIFRTDDGKEYPIGPAIVMDTILRLLDRNIDRLRASKRQQLVFERMKDITNFNGAADYLQASLLSFQNLTEQEKSAIADVVKQYREHTAWPEALRIMAIGYAFLTIVGQKNFGEVIASLKGYLDALATPPAPPPGSGGAPP
jgi:hypothetical protein